MSPKHSRCFVSDCEWHSMISQIRSKNIFLFEFFFSVGKTFEMAKLLKNAYEMVLSRKYSVFSRIKRFYFEKIGTFYFLKKENWRRRGFSRTILHFFFWKAWFQKLELLGSCLFSFCHFEWLKEKHLRKRWPFQTIVCHFRQSSADTRSWFQNSFENPEFSSRRIESSFVNNNGNVATTSHKTFRQKFKLLVKIWKKIRKKFSRKI